MAINRYSARVWEDTAPDWALDNTVYAANDLLFAKDTSTFKRGNGVNKYADLPFVGGSGVPTPPAWGSITGTLGSQTDLQAALTAKANAADLTSHTGNTGNPHAVTKAQIGLANVDNTSDANKPISAATQTALNLKADLNSPAFAGVPLAPTAVVATNNTQIATTAFVAAAVAASPENPTGANPTGSVGLTAVNGNAATFMRSDGAPAISQAITPTWIGAHVFSAASGASVPTVTIGGTNPQLDISNSGGVVDTKRWNFAAGTTTLSLRALTDAGGGANNAIVLTRTANAISQIDLQTANNTTRLSINNTGNVTLSNLAGTGSRTVVADANGILSATQAAALAVPITATSVPLTFGEVAANGFTDLGMDVPGVAFGDVVALGIPIAAFVDGVTFFAGVSNDNPGVVTIRCANGTTTPRTVPQGAYKVTVFKS